MSIKKEPVLTFYRPNFESELKIPYIKDGVSAGFPSPAADFMDADIDLNKELCKNQLSTFYIKVKGNSMINAGINNQDILVVDRSIEPQNNKIAICLIDGEFTVKRIKIEKNNVFLMPENESFQPIKITDENELIIWGIVTYVIKQV